MQGHIRKRGDNWQVAVYVGKEGKKRKYKYKTFKREKDAQKFRTELLHQIHNNNYFDPGNITFGQYLDRWMEDYCKQKLAPKTFIRYKEIVDLHIKPDLGLVLLARLQPLDLQRHYTKMLTKGRIGLKHKEQKGLSPTTVLFHHRIIHKALRQAVMWQLVGRNVADAVEPPSKADTEFEIISTEVLNKILEEVAANNPVLILPILLASLTGMRRGEVLGLKWKDFNAKTGRLNVKQQLQRLEGELVLSPLKTARSKRTIPLYDDMVEVLKKHKAEQNKIRLQEGKNYNPLELIFCWEDTGRPIDPDYMTKRFIKYAQKYVVGVRLHDLRHSFATMLLEKNVGLKKVSALLGHASISITGDIYSHITPSMEDEIAGVIKDEYKTLDCQGIVKERKKTPAKKLKAL